MSHQKRRCQHCGFEIIPDEDLGELCPVCNESDWLWHCSVKGETYTGLACPWCGYDFDGSSYHDLKLLAAALASKWRTALEHVAAMALFEWAEQRVSESRRTLLRDLAADPLLNHEQRLVLAVILIDDGHPVTWRGQQCDRNLLRSDIQASLLLLDAPMQGYWKHSAKWNWLLQFSDEWREHKAYCTALLRGASSHPSDSSSMAVFLGNFRATSIGDSLEITSIRLAIAASKGATTLKDSGKKWETLCKRVRLREDSAVSAPILSHRHSTFTVSEVEGPRELKSADITVLAVKNEMYGSSAVEPGFITDGGEPEILSIDPSDTGPGFNQYKRPSDSPSMEAPAARADLDRDAPWSHCEPKETRIEPAKKSLIKRIIHRLFRR